MRVYVRKCRECGNDFRVSGPAAGRRKLCSEECQRIVQRGAEARYREKQYDPWQWANTILEWNE